MYIYEDIVTIALDSIDLAKYETGLVYLFLALSMCPDAHRDMLLKIVDSIDTDKCSKTRVNDLVYEIVEEGIKNQKIKEIRSFLFCLFNSKNEFLFRCVLDSRIYHLYILLEATELEINNGKDVLSTDGSITIEDFIRISKKLRFAIRRIWGGISSGLEALKQLIYEYHLSVEIVGVLVIRSVSDEWQGAILTCLKKLYEREGSLEDAVFISKLIKSIGKCDKQFDMNYNAIKYKDNFGIVYVDALTNKIDRLYRSTGNNYKEISYILCANDEEYVQEIIECLNSQTIDPGYNITVYVVWNATGMAQGYNIGMAAAKGRVKIYIHQDVFFVEKTATMRFVSAIEESQYSLLGLVGCEIMPETGCWWESKTGEMGALYIDRMIHVEKLIKNPLRKELVKAEGLDGICLITDVDIRWRDDLFKGFHMYDASCVWEYKNRGYEVGILITDTPYILHEQKAAPDVNEIPYEESKEIFRGNYNRNETEINKC